VIRTEVFRNGLLSNRLIEHSAQRLAIYGSGLTAKSNDPSGELVHDDQHPMRPYRRRLASEEIDAPKAVLCLAQEGQTRGVGPLRIRRTMSLLISIPKAKAICWPIRGQPHVGLRCFIWITASIRSLPGPFGPGLLGRFWENGRRHLRFFMAWWRFKRVEGFSTIAERISRLGRMRRAHKPATRRSEVRRLADRCRERYRSRCLSHCEQYYISHSYHINHI
jgi:hypothetical protein